MQVYVRNRPQLPSTEHSTSTTWCRAEHRAQYRDMQLQATNIPPTSTEQAERKICFPSNLNPWDALVQLQRWNITLCTSSAQRKCSDSLKCVLGWTSDLWTAETSQVSHAHAEKCVCSEKTRSLNMWIGTFPWYSLTQIPSICKAFPFRRPYSGHG